MKPSCQGGLSDVAILSGSQSSSCGHGLKASLEWVNCGLLLARVHQDNLRPREAQARRMQYPPTVQAPWG